MKQYGELEFEIDKAKLVGRGNIDIPEMIAKSKPFSKSTSGTTESALAFRRTIKLAPKEEKQITLIISVGEDKMQVLKDVQKANLWDYFKRNLEVALIGKKVIKN